MNSVSEIYQNQHLKVIKAKMIIYDSLGQDIESNENQRQMTCFERNSYCFQINLKG